MRLRRTRSFRIAVPALLVCAVVAAAVAGVSTRSDRTDVVRIMLPERVSAPTGKQSSGASGRIINGSKASGVNANSAWRSITYLTVIRNDGSATSCGGTFVAKRYVLTAAHCLKDTAFVLGFNGGGDVRSVDAALRAAKTLDDVKKIPSKVSGTFLSTSLHSHPQYRGDATGTFNDVALIRVDRDARFAPTLIPGPNELGAWGGGLGLDTMRIAGWGDVDPAPGRFAASADLMEATVPAVSVDACRTNYASAKITINEDHLCGSTLRSNAAHQLTNGVDSCQGDSGGPAIGVASDGTVRLIGVTSFGVGCADTHYGVYANTSRYRTWIESIAGKVSGSTNTPVKTPTPVPTPQPDAPFTVLAPANGVVIGTEGTTTVRWSGGNRTKKPHVVHRSGTTEWDWWTAPVGATSVDVPNASIFRNSRPTQSLCVQSEWEDETAVCISFSFAKEAGDAPVVGGGGNTTAEAAPVVTSPRVLQRIGARGATNLAWSGGSTTGNFISLTKSGARYRQVYAAGGASSYLLGHGMFRTGVTDVCVWDGRTAPRANACVQFSRSSAPNSGSSPASALAWANGMLYRGGVLRVNGGVRSTTARVRVRVQVRQGSRWVTVGTKSMRTPSLGTTRFVLSKRMRFNARVRSVDVRTTVYYGSKSASLVTRMR